MDKITAEKFAQMITNPDPFKRKWYVTSLDNLFCKCGYVNHWVYNMQSGKWNPELTEMDYELRDVKTPEQLHEFLLTKI